MRTFLARASLFVPCVLFGVLAACGASSPTPSPLAAEPRAPHRILHLVGSIDDGRLPVSMDLLVEDTSVEGSYYYHRTGGWIGLVGAFEPDGSLLLRDDRFEADSGETFTLRGSPDGGFTGTWHGVSRKSRDAKSFTVSLREDFSASARFRVVRLHDRRKLGGADSAPAAEVLYVGLEASAVPSGGSADALGAALNEFQIGYVGQEERFPVHKGLAAYFTRCRDAFFEGYPSQPLSEDEKDLPEHVWNWTEYSKTIPRLNESGVLVLEASVYVYTGGAHGSYASEFGVFDLATGARVTETGLFQPGWSEKLRSVLREEVKAEMARRTGERVTDEDLFDMARDSFPVTNNFFLCREGVGFHYNIYELTAYAFGDFDIVLPWSRMREYLAPGTVVERLIPAR